MSHFFVNLMSKGIIDVKRMVDLIIELIITHDENSKKYISMENCSKYCE